MKIVFAGTPEFAAAALQALALAGHDIALVLTQPDRPAGRGLQPLPSAVKRLALEHGFTISQPASLKDPSIAGELARIAPDVMVVAAYGLIVPRAILAVPRLGCINIHASLLPRWRGAAPIQRALLAGDVETGISIMQMEAGLDTGPVILQQAVTITGEDTAQTLHDQLGALGAQLIVQALERPLIGQAQDDSRATYAAKIQKGEAHINWSETADTIERKIRAFNPVPGAVTSYEGGALKIWRADVTQTAAAAPGTVIKADTDGIHVACGSGSALRVLELQRAGGKRLATARFLAGNPIKSGDRLGV
jgi:methionyl-tRNA formyltransferase